MSPSFGWPRLVVAKMNGDPPAAIYLGFPWYCRGFSAGHFSNLLPSRGQCGEKRLGYGHSLFQVSLLPVFPFLCNGA